MRHKRMIFWKVVLLNSGGGESEGDDGFEGDPSPEEGSPDTSWDESGDND